MGVGDSLTEVISLFSVHSLYRTTNRLILRTQIDIDSA